MTHLAKRVRYFMAKAEQVLPDRPVMPDLAVRYLRLKTIAEELCELADAFGYHITIISDAAHYQRTGESKFMFYGVPYPGVEPNLVKAADATADLQMFVEGTGLAMGVDMELVAMEVCDANDTKFIDGHKDEFGKWVKGPSHRPPNIEPILVRQLEVARHRDCQLGLPKSEPVDSHSLPEVHICQGGSFPGTIVRYPSGFCNQCMGRGAVEVQMSEEDIKAHNWKVMEPQFTPWDGNYEKEFYDVLLPNGHVVKWCWPNAGQMNDIGAHLSNKGNQSWKPSDGIRVRLSPDHPMDDEKVPT